MLEDNVGRFVEMEGFISTTGKKDMGMLLAFAKNVIFELIVPDCFQQPRDDETDFGFLSIKEFSAYPQEEEYLFNVLNVFEVISISDFEYEGNIKVKWVKLQYGSLAESLWKKKHGGSL